MSYIKDATRRGIFADAVATNATQKTLHDPLSFENFHNLDSTKFINVWNSINYSKVNSDTIVNHELSLLKKSTYVKDVDPNDIVKLCGLLRHHHKFGRHNKLSIEAYIETITKKKISILLGGHGSYQRVYAVGEKQTRKKFSIEDDDKLRELHELFSKKRKRGCNVAVSSNNYFKNKFSKNQIESRIRILKNKKKWYGVDKNNNSENDIESDSDGGSDSDASLCGGDVVTGRGVRKNCGGSSSSQDDDDGDSDYESEIDADNEIAKLGIEFNLGEINNMNNVISGKRRIAWSDKEDEKLLYYLELFRNDFFKYKKISGLYPFEGVRTVMALQGRARQLRKDGVLPSE